MIGGDGRELLPTILRIRDEWKEFYKSEGNEALIINSSNLWKKKVIENKYITFVICNDLAVYSQELDLVTMSRNFLCWLIMVLSFNCSIHGLQPNKIIGPSTPVCTGHRAFQASLWVYLSSEKGWSYDSGGAILDKTHILTAAHCVHGLNTSQLQVAVGCIDIESTRLIFMPVSKIYVHNKFDDAENGEHELLTNDIAVLTLEFPLPRRKSIATVKLPEDNVRIGDHGVIAGWGSTTPNPTVSISPILRETSMQVLPPESCELPILPTQFCAKDSLQLRTVSTGDSGSPFVVNQTIVGILSGGTDRPYHPTYFTNVYPYLSFIVKILKKDIPPRRA